MFKSPQLRAKAAEYGELAKSAANADEGCKYQNLEDRFDALASNERGLVDGYYDAVHIELDRSRVDVLAAEEEQILRRLGLANIMQWATLPSILQREIFDTAGLVGQCGGQQHSAGKSPSFFTSRPVNPTVSLCL